MKRILGAAAVIFLGLFLISGHNNVFAKSKKELAAEEAAQQKKAQEEQKRKAAEEERRRALETARKALKAKEWTVYVSPESGAGKTETDVITFSEDDKVGSKNLLAKGYSESNFRLSVQDGAAVWETMKVDEDKNVAFFRGELKEEQMNGSIFYKFANGTTMTYLYTTTPPAAAAEEEGRQEKKKKGK